MSILCTFPGRHGDLLWALPTIRAISEAAGEPVDLQIAGEFGGLLPLLALQPYLRHILADPEWSAGESMPPTIFGGPKTPVYHLGYPRWPELPLPFETQETARALMPADLNLHLDQPWLQAIPMPPRDVVFGFTDCWFELKYGLTELLFPDEDREPANVNAIGIFPPGSRWVTEGDYKPTTWLEAAGWISSARALLTDCSALHVLAVALGIPTVIVEPMEARWNPIFYPLGYDGPQVTVVKGLDGKPTFDARHVTETLSRVIIHGR